MEKTKKTKDIYETVTNNMLWDGIEYGEFEKIFGCIEAKTESYKKGDIILLSGDTVKSIGIILSGSVNVIKEDADGNITILTELTAPELFAEVFACAGIDHSPVTVQASEDSKVMFINFQKIIAACSHTCNFHTKLIENMLKLIAKKTLMLNQKIEILSKRTTREKLLAFFDMQRGGTAKKFTIPYDREELAQYLCVERSAMSKELCKMRDDGLIKFKKNKFEIL